MPSQLLPGVALGTGAGEIVEHFEPLAEHAFVVLPSSEFELSTPDVFREADRLGLQRSDAELDGLYEELVAALWRPMRSCLTQLLVNDLEAGCGVALPMVRRRAGGDARGGR